MQMWSIGAQPIGISNMISEPNPINADGCVANQMPRAQKHVTPAILVVLVFAVQACFAQVKTLLNTVKCSTLKDRDWTRKGHDMARLMGVRALASNLRSLPSSPPSGKSCNQPKVR